MFCKSCGKQIDDDSTFCPICGTKQTTDLKPKAESTFSNSPIIVRQSKYDETYKMENDAITLGIFLLAIALIFAIVGPIKFEDRKSFGQFPTITAIVSLIIRIIVTVWVVNIAKRQNREPSGWGLFAFLLPSIALIVVATRKKLFAKVEIVDGLNNEQNSKVLYNKAQEFYNDKKYSESIRFSEKALELDKQNFKAIELLERSKEEYKEYLKNADEEQIQDLLRKYSLNDDHRKIPEFTEIKSSETSSLLNGKYFEIEILFADGKRTTINLVGKSKKYFIEYGLNKVTYFDNKNDCISYVYNKL